MKIAQPILKYVDKAGVEYFSHVNEKGTYLIGKIRADNMKTSEYYRDKARKGELNGYSVNVVPLERNGKTITDMEYTAITITEKGVMRPRNPMTRDVKVLSKGEVITPTLNSEESLDAESILRKHGFNHCTK
jgi:hypothetical protein